MYLCIRGAALLAAGDERHAIGISLRRLDHWLTVAMARDAKVYELVHVV